jgi:hypothetical protein
VVSKADEKKENSRPKTANFDPSTSLNVYPPPPHDIVNNWISLSSNELGETGDEFRGTFSEKLPRQWRLHKTLHTLLVTRSVCNFMNTIDGVRQPNCQATGEAWTDPANHDFGFQPPR